ncbi:MAG: LPS export ABC transporter permease LptG [Haliea sp.]|jgi:lipopolysaccharide export system permease protein|uniref:LPS export ABC transporter permease LptG n=1 Tax=Haliea sp. TaxID=1932666 RepID=UPI000C39272A|nr:LPS export ABC transporter permease LptG [Haliea sp.]MBM70139.1 LPS export ABC transporter permease LptG [Haliea sp.]|tara:strand:- start:24724 stop:25785 length:1062 start_codon:yes stop_codon:yes gene_type:complete
MRLLDWYIGRTLLASIFLVLLVIVGIDVVSVFIDESGNLSETYTFLEVSRYVLLTIPGRLYEFIPSAALIGSLVGLGQLATASELTVMRGAGVSIARLVVVVMKYALLVALAGFTLGEVVAPPAEQLAESRRALAQSAPGGLAGRYGIWNREGDSYLYFNAVESETSLRGVLLVQLDERRRMVSSLAAPRARFAGDHWVLEDVVKTDFSSWATTRTRAETLRWDTGITPQLLTMEVVSPERLPLIDLQRYSLYLQQQGLDADDFELAMWRKLLQPASIAGLVLVAIAFIFGPLRDGTLGLRIFAGVLVGVTFQIGEDLLGPASLVFGFPPLYAALAPVLLCIGAGVVLLLRTR